MQERLHTPFLSLPTHLPHGFNRATSEYGLDMNENQLLKFWVDQRSARIRAQIPPSIILASVLALACTGHLSHQSALNLRIYTLGLVIAVGLISYLTIFSTFRDGISVIRTLEDMKGLTPFAKDIRNSMGSHLLSIAIFTLLHLVIFSLLYSYLFLS